MKFSRHLFLWPSLILLLAFLTMRFLFGLSVMVNISDSEPFGLYLLDLSSSQQIRRGDLVAACIPLDFASLAFRRTYLKASSTCPGHVIPVLKRVYGVPGDRVVLGKNGTVINGQTIPNTRRLAVDTSGHPVPHVTFSGKLSGYLLLAPTYHLSFDGRYFGPVAPSDIIGRVTPLFTFRRVP